MSVNFVQRTLRRGAVVALICTGLGSQLSCLVDKPKAPDLAGPSELGTSLEMRAIPDQLVADGFSSSVIEAVVRGPNGERVSGTEVLFDISSPDSSGFLDLGNLSHVNGARPTAGGVEPAPVSSVSDAQGVARARYWAPFRTDQVNDTQVIVTGRPAGTDYNAAVLRDVAIFLRAADRPSFPGSNICGFHMEPNKDSYKVGESISFTATQLTGDDSVDGCAGNSIARYEWSITDGTYAEDRGLVHRFDTDGTFTITLKTTESVTGCVDSCSQDVEIVP